jgi:uncharacterized protein YbdZ (MbtH family)
MVIVLRTGITVVVFILLCDNGKYSIWAPESTLVPQAKVYGST